MVGFDLLTLQLVNFTRTIFFMMCLEGIGSTLGIGLKSLGFSSFMIIVYSQNLQVILNRLSIYCFEHLTVFNVDPLLRILQTRKIKF